MPQKLSDIPRGAGGHRGYVRYYSWPLLHTSYLKSVNHIDRLTLEVGYVISDIWCVGCVGIRAALEVLMFKYP